VTKGQEGFEPLVCNPSTGLQKRGSKPNLDRIYAPIPPIPKPSDYISLPLRRVIVKTDGPEKYLPEEQDSTITNPDKYLLTGEIADMIAEIVGMETFSSGRYNSDRRANFT